MPLIDDQGRLFGRWNLVDAGAVCLVGVLIPLAYGAWLLFTPPAPRLISLSPAEVTLSNAGQSFAVTTEDLPSTFRFALRHRTGAPEVPQDVIGVDFTWRNPLGGAFTVDPKRLVQGVYDLVLFDEAQPLTSLAQALVIWPDPPLSPVTPPQLRGPRFVLETDERIVLPPTVRFLVWRDRVTQTCVRYRHVVEERTPLPTATTQQAEQFLLDMLVPADGADGLQNHPGVQAADVLLRLRPGLPSDSLEDLGLVPCRDVGRPTSP